MTDDRVPSLCRDGLWLTDLAKEAANRTGQRSFHVFAEGMHSDARGEFFNLLPGQTLPLPYSGWTHHLFIALNLSGHARVEVEGASVDFGPMHQLVVSPGRSARITARSATTIQVISFLTAQPRAPA